MAEFCKQCAAELDFPCDFTNLFREDSNEPDPDRQTGYLVLCEGCGYAFIVDDEGTCAAHDCLKHHGAN